MIQGVFHNSNHSLSMRLTFGVSTNMLNKLVHNVCTSLGYFVRCLLCMNHDGYRLSENIFEPIKFQMAIPGLFLFISNRFVHFTEKNYRLLWDLNLDRRNRRQAP